MHLLFIHGLALQHAEADVCTFIQYGGIIFPNYAHIMTAHYMISSLSFCTHWILNWPDLSAVSLFGINVKLDFMRMQSVCKLS